MEFLGNNFLNNAHVKWEDSKLVQWLIKKPITPIINNNKIKTLITENLQVYYSIHSIKYDQQPRG